MTMLQRVQSRKRTRRRCEITSYDWRIRITSASAAIVWLCCYLSFLPQQTRAYLPPPHVLRHHQQQRHPARIFLTSFGLRASESDDDEAKIDTSSLSSRDKALSALSKPNAKRQNNSGRFFPSLNRTSTVTVDSLLPPPLDPLVDNQQGAKHKKTKHKRAKMHPSKKFLHARDSNSNTNGTSTNNKPTKTRKAPRRRKKSPYPPPVLGTTSGGNEGYSSLLPPPLHEDMGSLSSWEQFLGAKPRPTDSTDQDQQRQGSNSNDTPTKGSDSSSSDESPPPVSRLPSITDLFPPELSNTSAPSSARNQDKGVSNTDVASLFPSLPKKPDESKASASSSSSKSKQSSSSSSSYSLNGALPVSDLFFRSSSPELGDDDDDDDDGDGGDDEELPFSMEQSDQLSTDHNEVKIRRNQAQKQPSASSSKTKSSRSNNKSNRSSKKRSGRRKMVRRGMEMLVGGVPINADPPQRTFELWYDPSPCEVTEGKEWYKVISLNTRDFGPILHTGSLEHLTDLELGLFCEHFVHATMKWDVCPKDLRDIAKQYYLEQERSKKAMQEIQEKLVAVQPIADENGAIKATDTIYGGECVFIFHIPLPELVAGGHDDKNVLTDGEIALSKMIEQVYRHFVDKGIEEKRWGRFELNLANVVFTELKGGNTRMDSHVLLCPHSSNKGDSYRRDKEAESIHRFIEMSTANIFRELLAAQVEKESTWTPEFRAHMVSEIMDEGGEEENPFQKEGKAKKKLPPAPTKGFGQNTAGKDKGKKTKSRKKLKTKNEEVFTVHFASTLDFSIGISQAEIEMGAFISDSSNEIEGKPGVLILERVLKRGVISALEKELHGLEWGGFDVIMESIEMKESDDGTTSIASSFKVVPKTTLRSFDQAVLEKQGIQINMALSKAMDDGEMQMAVAAAAKEEEDWPQGFRDRMVEEFLFEEDEEDRGIYEADYKDNDPGTSGGGKAANRSPDSSQSTSNDNQDDSGDDDNHDHDGPFGSPGGPVYEKDDIFLGGGNDGVFWDYSSASAATAPFKGELGPKLLEAVVKRCKKRTPRVIAIGDVHGCIDELQDLLRQCDFQPGDLIVFLGDLVSKGPDSISVVQMAREIGAIGIRGNHDFEVIRWHQAIKSGVDAPVVGSEHFHVASCLTKADVKWLYSLPWYINSKELGALFVHAGFVSGIRLAKQNPRLMMNMRSILPDGTVTSKFFNNWPWARLWDGPQTVLFGHDADRGLQQYEHAIGLDTGCVYGGRLTACFLPEKRLVSVSARREYFKYRRKHYD